MKIFKWASDNILFLLTLFLLAFIPLYPKRPLIDVVNTWVYVRTEDFVVLLVLFMWILLLLRRKVTLRSPLTIPIMLFWIAGGLATIHGVLLIFPHLANVFPNVAFLSFLRRIEYMSVFFVAFAGMKDKRFLTYVIAILVVTLLCVVFYGFGQKQFGFPAFLTMNEEFAKGAPIVLSDRSRISSTFAGHYDLAAYLVFIIPILTSLIFGFKKWFIKIILFVSVFLGFILLFMTVSRVSLFGILIALILVLLFQKKKLIFYSLPIVAVLVILFSFLLLSFKPALLDRFTSTITEINVLVDAKTGEPIGQVDTIKAELFKDKVFRQTFVRSPDELTSVIKSKEESPLFATPSAIIPFNGLPAEITILIPPNTPTGENLPQGTEYINLSLSPVSKRIGQLFYEKTKDQVLVVNGDFLIKRASAYDLSFTTRFQGEWPNTLLAFERNIFLGSGYGSVSLAVDNNYLRLLGEGGLVGLAAFLGVFLTIGIYIHKTLPQIDSPVERSFIVGFAAGVVGLMLNGLLIDVFEASKIAFLLWLLTGVVLGTLSFYQTNAIDLLYELKRAITSPVAIIFYLLVVVFVVFSPMLSNYFIGDDFTWFRFATDCHNSLIGGQGCPSLLSRILQFFTSANGFFYRPGTKVYFLLMHSAFWLNQTIYHLVSLLLHFATAVLVFFLARKILKNAFFSALASFFFLILSGYAEAVFWISGTGHLFNAICILLSLLFFIKWEEKKKIIYYILSFLSLIFGLLFHELGVITPLLIIAYTSIQEEAFNLRMLKKIHYLLLFVPIVFYLFLRSFAGSHWFNGDYSYNLLKLPFNFVGNAIGYLFLSFFGPLSLTVYELFRNFAKGHIFVAIVVCLAIVIMFVLSFRILNKKIAKEDKKVILFGFCFFLITLLPFLGLGNITSRYSYLSSIGFILLFVFGIKKLYEFLLADGRHIALTTTTVVLSLFCLLHIMQIQQIHSDWHTAGDKTKRFFVAIDEAYQDYWATEPMEFHFVNVPIRQGEAWVFPVGLPDALWLVFGNPNIHVYEDKSLDQAFSEVVAGSRNQKIFVFDEDGGLSEKKKPLAAQ